MSWSGGVYSRIHNWVADAAAAINILPTRMDEEDDSIAAGLNLTLTRDGNTSPTANINWGGFRITNLGAASAATDAAQLQQVQNNVTDWVAAGGAVDAITATYNPAITSLTDGLKLRVRSSGANTVTNPTFSPNGLTARTITKNGGAALLAGDIGPAGMEFELTYRLSATRWELTDPSVTYAVTSDIAAGTSSKLVLTPAALASSAPNLASVSIGTGATTVSTIILSTDGSAAEAVGIDQFRDSGSPAANDLLMSQTWSARSSTAVKRTIAKFLAKLLTTTNAAEDGELRVSTMRAGTVTENFVFGKGGAYTPNATGGDKGADTINASVYYQAGNPQLSPLVIVSGTTASPALTDNGTMYIPTGAGFTLTLPALAGMFNGYRIGLQNQCASGTCLANRSSTDTIISQGTTGLTSITLPSVSDAVWFIADVTNSRWLLQGMRSFTGTANSTISTTQSLTHLLGVRPQFVTARMINTITNLSWAVNDRMDPAGVTTNSGGGYTIGWDGTTIYVGRANAATAALDKSTPGAATAITTADWSIEVNAVVFN